MEVLTAVVGSLAGKATEYTVNPIARQVGYLFNYKSKCEELKAQLEKLKDAREQVQQRIDEAKRKGDHILDRVETWLNGVNGKITAAEQLVEDETEAKKRFFSGLCPNFKSRYQFSKKAVKEANSIAELLEREGRFESVSYCPVPEGMAPVKGYEEFESRRGAFDGVMKALEEANPSIIGVYGMGGVGKTTLVKQVASQAKEKKLVGYVVLAAVTQTPNMLNVQNEIAEKLGMKFDVDSMGARASLLRERLREEKGTVLIILDDIWSPLNLDDELGIPSGDMGCKILMTSRRLDLLQSMGSKNNLEIKLLTEEEAWNLFQNKAGDIVGRRKIRPTAVEIAKKCAGLPIAIATIGRALKDKKSTHWKNTLRELKRPSVSNFKGIPGEVYKSIELSYGFLETQELRSTFLLCSIMGHNATVEDLLRYCKGLGLIHGVDTIEEARDKVSTWIDELKASCLLLDGSTSGHVDIHDVVRDVAISIASRDNHWLALGRDDVSQDWSNEEAMKNYDLISLQQYGKVSELTELDHELKCPQLSFFFMGSDRGSFLKIPNNFFMGMRNVKVLAFVRIDFSSLPSSIEFLENLRTLCLRGCGLKDMAIVCELENLEILDLSYNTEVKRLSSEIGKLRRLKLLDLTGCDLEVIPPNVLSGLSRLEELYLKGGFDRWEVVDEGRESPVGSNASLVELNKLSHLTVLEVCVPNVKAMPMDTTFFGNLERYNISIGQTMWNPWDYELESLRMLKLSCGWDKMFDGRLLIKVENLWLNYVDDITNLERISYSELNVESFSQLSVLRIYGCERLKNLFSFSIAKLSVGSFSQLRVLEISGCKRLKNLFSFSIAKEFCQLEEIDVSNCGNITELIAEKGEAGVLKFNKLKSLKLRCLPKLICMYGAKKNLGLYKQGSNQSTNSGSNALYLFDHKVALPMLEVLEITEMENLERLWPNQLADKESFSRLTQFYLKMCHKLLKVFPLSMLRRIQRLKELTIKECELVEEIFEAPHSIAFELPQLTKLELVKLPNLKSFYHQPSLFCLNELSFTNLEEVTMTWNDGVKEIFHANALDPQLLAFQYFCSLKVVRIESFPKEMDTFPFKLFQFLISLPNLQYMEINDAYFIQILEEVQEKEGVFQTLKHLQVRSCPELKDNLVPSSLSFPNLVDLKVGSCGIIKLVTHSVAKSLGRLQKMTIYSCFQIEEIIEGSRDDDEDGEVKSELLHFPQLKLLELIQLPKLKSFCSSRNYTFHFPSLQIVLVQNCPQMKVFSKGYPNTPMLKKVKSSQYELDFEGWPWLGDLNRTIQHMFKGQCNYH